MQNFKFKLKSMFQDSESAIKLIKSGKKTYSKCTHDFCMRFYTTDIISSSRVTITSYPTKKIIVFCMLKFLVSYEFKILYHSISKLRKIHNS